MAAGTVFLDDGQHITPRSALETLRRECRHVQFVTDNEASSGGIALNLSYMVEDIYRALTNNVLQFLSQEPSHHRTVITDHSYRLNDKSSHVFDGFMRGLMSHLGSWPETLITSRGSLTSYEAILGK
ncbi:hypothetical protein F5148DRAFT_1374706, partial [Russula earlei]